MRAGSAEPAFADGVDGGVADPLTGRIGYVMTDPADGGRTRARAATCRSPPAPETAAPQPCRLLAVADFSTVVGSG